MKISLLSILKSASIVCIVLLFQTASFALPVVGRVDDFEDGTTMGWGGKTTALAVKIETAPCHIASLPAAVNIECHSHRHKTAIL